MIKNKFSREVDCPALKKGNLRVRSSNRTSEETVGVLQWQ